MLPQERADTQQLAGPVDERECLPPARHHGIVFRRQRPWLQAGALDDRRPRRHHPLHDVTEEQNKCDEVERRQASTGLDQEAEAVRGVPLPRPLPPQVQARGVGLEVVQQMAWFPAEAGGLPSQTRQGTAPQGGLCGVARGA